MHRTPIGHRDPRQSKIARFEALTPHLSRLYGRGAIRRQANVSRPIIRSLAAGTLLIVVLAACAQGDVGLATSPSPTPTESPSPSPSRSPYTEFTTYQSNDPRADDFRFEFPSGWEVFEPDNSEDVGSWTYYYHHESSVAPATADCGSAVNIQLSVTIGDVSERPSSFPAPDGERQVGENGRSSGSTNQEIHASMSSTRTTTLLDACPCGLRRN